MAPSIQLQRARAAIKAMKLLEFDEDVAKRVLKELLKVYGNNWEHIEAENYSLLVDAILDCQESKDPEPSQNDASISDDLMQPAKRLRHIEDPGSSQTTIEPDASGETLLRKRKFVAAESTLINPRGELNKTAEAQCSYAGKGTSLSPDSFFKNGSAGIGEMAPQSAIDFEDPSALLRCTKLSRHTEVLQEAVVINTSTIPDNLINITNKDISTNDNVPIAMEAPIGIPQGIADEAGEVGCSGANALHGLTQASSTLSAPNKVNDTESFQAPAQHEIANVQNTITTNVKIASSKMGEEDVSKFSLLKESLNGSKSAGIHHRLSRRFFNGSPSLGSRETRRSANILQSSLAVDGDSNGTHENCAQNILPLLENAVITSSPRNDEHDIAKGEERLTISVINEFNSEIKPPYFHYIPQNAIYQNAHVNFSLAQIAEDDCCINCFGNCLSASIPCPCTRETGGEFVYTTDGLLKKEFLNQCISFMNCYTDRPRVYCKNCPLRSFNGEDKLVACKGHLVRKFIKECWSKCGCNKQCGNRVVQRGITRNLQVFYTADGKGWGLRTLEELPRGAFVCEDVGEILTTRELYDRTMQGYGSAKNIYTLVLDADWGSEEGLRDEEALCLDATFYGNVGRFINHRCFDANLIEVPVQWETPDHHYYHLAYFTTRKVEALEELTWDYGINFKNHAHPIKAFKCLCGSRVCRDSCRSS